MPKQNPFKEFEEKLKMLKEQYTDKFDNIIYLYNKDKYGYNQIMGKKLQEIEVILIEMNSLEYLLRHAKIQFREDD
jgi:hypothetical protein